MKLERDFDKELSLLWDMSSETDVMNYLVEKDIFSILRDTILSSTCNRLTVNPILTAETSASGSRTALTNDWWNFYLYALQEIALGILANLISSSSILETFPQVDEKFSLVEQVITVAMSTAHVPVLNQAFAVLRRVVWYIRNVEPVTTWLTALTTEQFVTMVNFLMKSSTNGKNQFL
jgi:hypothetical protein